MNLLKCLKYKALISIISVLNICYLSPTLTHILVIWVLKKQSFTCLHYLKLTEVFTIISQLSHGLLYCIKFSKSMFWQEWIQRISNNTFQMLLKYLNTVCNKATLLLFMKTYSSFGLNKQFMKFYWKIEDLLISTRTLKMELQLELYLKSMPIMRY